MDNQGLLTVISGFSGAGKGTLVKELCRRYGYKLSISATSRSPRQGEAEGVDYFYKSREEFERMIEEEELIEWVEYVGNYYGTPKQYIHDCIAKGEHVILEIEVKGALNVKKDFPNALLVFITPPSAAELKRRLELRGTETPEQIAGRLKRAAEESSFMPSYDYIVINDVFEACVEQTHYLIQNELTKTRYRKQLIHRMSDELRQLSEEL